MLPTSPEIGSLPLEVNFHNKMEEAVKYAEFRHGSLSTAIEEEGMCSHPSTPQ